MHPRADKETLCITCLVAVLERYTGYEERQLQGEMCVSERQCVSERPWESEGQCVSERQCEREAVRESACEQILRQCVSKRQ